MVFFDTLVGIADEADEVGVQVFFSINKIQILLGDWIVKHAVNGKVSAFGIFFGRGENDGVGAAAVGIAGVGAEGGDFEVMAVLDNQDDAELFTDGNGVGEDFFQLVGGGVGHNVEIFGVEAEEHIANTTTCEIGGVTGALEGADEVDGGEVHGDF